MTIYQTLAKRWSRMATFFGGKWIFIYIRHISIHPLIHCLLLTSFQFSSISLWLLNLPFALVKTRRLNIKSPIRSSCMYIFHLYHTQSVKMNIPNSSHLQEYYYWILCNPSEVLTLNLPGRNCEMLTFKMQTTAFPDVGEKHWNFLYRPKAEFHIWKDWFGLHGTESDLCKSTSHTLWFILGVKRGRQGLYTVWEVAIKACNEMISGSWNLGQFGRRRLAEDIS
jgi:hypothetical protein